MCLADNTASIYTESASTEHLIVAAAGQRQLLPAPRKGHTLHAKEQCAVLNTNNMWSHQPRDSTQLMNVGYTKSNHRTPVLMTNQAPNQPDTKHRCEA